MNKQEKDFLSNGNIVYVGNKPPMNYVTAVIALLNSGNVEEVTIKGRGNAISRAVDTAEITRNRFVTDAKIKNIQIGTESMTAEDGRKLNVSSIEICLTRREK